MWCTTPTVGRFFVSIFLLVQFILSRDIQSVALKVCIGLKPELHVKKNIKLLILVAPETQVNLQNRPEDQLLARQHT